MPDNEVMEKPLFLQVWCGESLHGAVRLKLSSVAALAVLKFFEPRQNAEFRDPVNHEIYRYDASADSLCKVVALI
jgi:hypothetical protein